MTNGDKIRQMSNEELAKWLEEKARSESCSFCICLSSLFCDYRCIEGIKAYLDMEANQ